MPNMAGVSNDMLKNQAKMFKNMGDAELQRYIDQMKAFNPMFANITPAQLRNMGDTMGNMSDDQINNAKNMA
jgi:hypothetical protein